MGVEKEGRKWKMRDRNGRWGGYRGDEENALPVVCHSERSEGSVSLKEGLPFHSLWVAAESRRNASVKTCGFATSL